MVRMIGVRDFSPKSFHVAFVSRTPYSTGPGLPPVVSPVEASFNPLRPTGPEYRCGDGGNFAHLGWLPGMRG
jgi:hypothetical protein